MHDELERHNKRATIVLLAAGFLLLFLATLAVEYLIFGFGAGNVPASLAAASPLLVIALLVAGGGSAYAWWNSDTVAIRSARARPASREQYPDLYRLTEGITLAAGLPMPDLYIVDDPAPNAFATGRNPDHAALAVTTGLLERMDRRELEAVIGHEVGHIRNNDLLTATLAVTLAGATILLADIARRSLWFGGMGGGRRRGGDRDGGGGGAIAVVLLVASLLVIVFAPIAAQLIRFAVSRQREYLADATSVEFTRDPASMIRALQALEADTTEIHTASRATAHLWIEEPMNLGRRANRAVATHPPLADRIARLRTLWPETLEEEPPPPTA